MSLEEACCRGNRTPPPHEPNPFQTTPTTGNREAHRVYLTFRLQDHFHDPSRPLSPGYSRAQMAYFHSVEPRLLEATALKHREADRARHQIEKTRRKSGSGKHVQKKGVLYKGRGVAQIAERTREEQEYRDSIINAADVRKQRKEEKEARQLARSNARKAKAQQESI